MYTTAHRVRSRDGQSGVNSFRYEHGDDEGGLINWDTPDVAAIADGYLGVLMVQSYDVPPGGNRVLAYLDVAAADGVEIQRVVRALDVLSNQVGREPSPIVVVLNGVGVRFGWEYGVTPAVRREFDELRSRILEILRAERPIAGLEFEPLVAGVSFDENGYSFELTPESIARVREAHRTSEFAPVPVRVSPETMMDFQQLHGDIIPTIVAGLTNLRLEKVLAIGGVVFLGQDGKEVRRWPRISNQ